MNKQGATFVSMQKYFFENNCDQIFKFWSLFVVKIIRYMQQQFRTQIKSITHVLLFPPTIRVFFYQKKCMT